MQQGSVTRRSARSCCRLWPRHGVALALSLLAAGCTTFSPQTLESVPYLSRSQTDSEGRLTVTVAVPTREEAAAIYGVDLADKGLQPVWVDVTNDEVVPYWFLPSGLDPAYYSAAEAAHPFRTATTGAENESGPVYEHFKSLEFKNPVHPGTRKSGFVIVNRDEGFRAVDIDMVARHDARSFTFIVFDPTFKGDYTTVDFKSLYDSSQIVDIQDENELRRALERLPCCTTNKDASDEGDPLNLVLIGDTEDLFPAYIRRGWRGTEIVYWDALWRMAKSFVAGERYLYSPVSPLYYNGRGQDLALQKARGTIHERNHLRMWLTPLRFRGEPVWVGQISRDIGVKVTTKSPTITTHVIDPNVDEARRYLLEDLAFSQALARIAFVKGVGAAPEDNPRFNLTDDPYYTDGLRAVLFFEPRPRTLDELDFMDWELPPRSRSAFKTLQ
ncbi:MAG: LssY C-terminal domain-containing protein [Gammaproteobacteria bacterium]|nr:LssY C-terminal domain-containing protein [Gammaproteobacteria bacterium]